MEWCRRICHCCGDHKNHGPHYELGRSTEQESELEAPVQEIPHIGNGSREEEMKIGGQEKNMQKATKTKEERKKEKRHKKQQKIRMTESTIESTIRDRDEIKKEEKKTNEAAEEQGNDMRKGGEKEERSTHKKGDGTLEENEMTEGIIIEQNSTDKLYEDGIGEQVRIENEGGVSDVGGTEDAGLTEEKDRLLKENDVAEKGIAEEKHQTQEKREIAKSEVVDEYGIQEIMKTKEENRVTEGIEFEKVKGTSENDKIDVGRCEGHQMQNQVQAQAGDQAVAATHAEETCTIEEKARKDVMEMSLESVSTVKFARTLNKSHGDVLNYLATYLNFNRFELDKVKDYKFGGGSPHEKFVDYLLRQKIEIVEVINAASCIENETVVEVLTELKEDGKGKMNEIDVCEALNLYAPLYHDVENPATELKSWKVLAGELGWSDKVADIETVLPAGGVFNGGQAFVAALEAQGKSVGYLMDVLKKDFGPNAPSMTKVANIFKEAVDKKVSHQITKLAKEEEKRLLASLR